MYTASAMLKLTQVLYNQTAITALKLAKSADDINNLSIRKSKEEIGVQVAKMYALALTTMEQQKLVLFNLQNIWQVFYLLMVLESMLQRLT
jgi:hypothetical protein